MITPHHRYYCAVLGTPITHSLSPFIQRAFAAQFQLDLVYERFEVDLVELPIRMQQLQAQGYRGLNLTAPLKHAAYLLATQWQASAARTQAANTVIFRDQYILAANTDTRGFARDCLSDCSWPVSGKRCLILGAGGAVAGILPALMAAGMAITIANRHVGRAQALAQFYGGIDTCELALLCGTYDLIINALPTSAWPQVGELLQALDCRNSAIYDLSYDLTQLTPCLTYFAKQDVTQLRDGFGMLCYQGALSFQQWFAYVPKVCVKALRQLAISV